MGKNLKLHLPRTKPEGFILVAVLWILGSLSVMVSIYAAYVIESIPGFAAHENQFRNETLVAAALELTAYRQLAISALSRPTHGQFSFRLDKANVAVEFRSEDARIDLNAASPELLAGLFRSLGTRDDSAESYADRVVAWRTSVGATSAPATQQTSETDSAIRQSNFRHTRELMAVPDMPPSLFEKALPFLTVYSGRGEININDAAPEVLAALPGMTSDRLTAFLSQRRLSSDEIKMLLTEEAQKFVTTEGSRAVRVTVRVTLDRGFDAQTEAVILLFDVGKAPYSVLSWRDAR